MSHETAKSNDQPASERSCPDPAGSVNLGDLSSRNRLKGVTKTGVDYAMHDLHAKVVPLEVAEKLHTALQTTLECLEMGGFGKSYAESLARKTLDEIHSQNDQGEAQPPAK